ncbi:hypothetical protein H257_12849 [Aphanomyces astaci]|uniref:Uncharacterized protein n=1 Tax=Aphanomyces astaci TaxID=112090 RepID=W4FX48_APHAT|nr:hypothetical protein H257_12849 [Aphanomyces astaci]ETV72052.1 hypothetical protein H257_12849 [Aphanomyces astaci]|eukprot:XP_009838495.1 hypothetical protein H257_12849 [Aphanomyces astaci]
MIRFILTNGKLPLAHPWRAINALHSPSFSGGDMRLNFGQYIFLFGVSIGSLFAGSIAMHAVLKPDLTIPDLAADDLDDNDRKK